MTNLKSITASSPNKTNWSPSSPPVAATQPPVLRALRRLLWPTRNNDNRSIADEPIISDSITDSKGLQNSIRVLTDGMDEHEVHCCKKEEANQVIRALQKKAAMQIEEGKLHDALNNLNNALSLQQKLYGTHHSEVASTLNMMGEVLSGMGEDYRYMAMTAFEESLAIRQGLEPGSEDTAVTLKNLWLLFHQSNIAREDTTIFNDFGSNDQVQ